MKANLVIIDFQTNATAESRVTKVLENNGAEIEDWMEKEYGIKVFVIVPDYNLARVRSAVNSIQGVVIE